MARIFYVQVGEYRPAGCFDGNGLELKRGEQVIVDLDRSSEMGRVVAEAVVHVEGGRLPSAQGKVLRKVTDGDRRQIENNRNKSKDALNVCISKVNELKLDMKMLNAEYSFDATKVILYFTAEGRVDFRNLVKELAKVFRLRIELKQIGVRDRAKMVKGYGVCGQELCCANFIKDFSQLSIKMAKEQALPLNPSKISGVCGRIKCCMAYEFNVYKELNRGLPKMGAKIQVPEGRGRVINLDILKRLVYLDTGDGKIVKINMPLENAHDKK
ncbi:MAG: stage 0 sporulation protein [Candidatus Omnitrophica bacterium]|nr:stage 0 sporulation protein [Candidatus Omnitrophota bacterium]